MEKQPQAMGEGATGPSRTRIRAIQCLGGECECCGLATPEFLQFDHIAGVGSGAIDRKLFRRRGDAWLRRIISGQAGGLRLLCCNCHFSITQYHYCPHERGDS